MIKTEGQKSCVTPFKGFLTELALNLANMAKKRTIYPNPTVAKDETFNFEISTWIVK
jgi:hypothetical protein